MPCFGEWIKFEDKDVLGYFFHLSDDNDKETSLCWWHFICSVILPIATIAFKNVYAFVCDSLFYEDRAQ